MRGTRHLLAGVVSLVGLSLIATPAAAQASATAELINDLNADLLWAAIPITVLTEAILIYTVYRFRNNDEPSPTKENRRLEITWTIATALVLLFVGVASYGVLANEYVAYTPEDAPGPQGDDVVVRAESFQWGWDMRYPEAGNFTTDNIVIPEDREVYIRVTSQDVLHAFHVPGLGLKQDAMPGSVLTIKTVAYKRGEYQGYCAEFCGVAHSQMYFTVTVVSDEEYQEFLEANRGNESAGNATGGSGGASNSSAVVMPNDDPAVVAD